MLSLILLMMASVEEVVCEVRQGNYRVAPGKQVSVNGPANFTSHPSPSVIHCSARCQRDDDCVAANYEDAGVCHMSSAGCIYMKDNSRTTSIVSRHASIHAAPKGNFFST